MQPIPRREALKEIAVAGAIAVTGLPDAVSGEDATNPIRTANARPGTRGS